MERLKKALKTISEGATVLQVSMEQRTELINANNALTRRTEDKVTIIWLPLVRALAKKNPKLANAFTTHLYDIKPSLFKNFHSSREKEIQRRLPA